MLPPVIPSVDFPGDVLGPRNVPLAHVTLSHDHLRESAQPGAHISCPRSTERCSLEPLDTCLYSSISTMAPHTELTPVSAPKNNNDAIDDLTYGDKGDATHLEDKAQAEVDYADQHAPVLSSVWEDIPYKTTLRLFWRGALVCFLAAFSSFTDGYQVCFASLQT